MCSRTVGTVGSHCISHPAIEPYTVTVSPGAEADPLIAGINAFDARDEAVRHRRAETRIDHVGRRHGRRVRAIEAASRRDELIQVHFVW